MAGWSYKLLNYTSTWASHTKADLTFRWFLLFTLNWNRYMKVLRTQMRSSCSSRALNFLGKNNKLTVYQGLKNTSIGTLLLLQDSKPFNYYYFQARHWVIQGKPTETSHTPNLLSTFDSEQGLESIRAIWKCWKKISSVLTEMHHHHQY